MFTIKDGRLFQGTEDISEDIDIKTLEEDGKTLLLYAKFKTSVAKAAEACFGTPKKRATKAKPKIKPEAEAEAEAAVVAAAPVYGMVDANGTQTNINMQTGEVVEEEMLTAPPSANAPRVF